MPFNNCVANRTARRQAFVRAPIAVNEPVLTRLIVCVALADSMDRRVKKHYSRFYHEHGPRPCSDTTRPQVVGTHGV